MSGQSSQPTINSQGNKARDTFGSRFGILVAMTGSAVGLGNLWRFPYLVGENGGAAFIIIYLAFVLFMCIPIMISEFVIGRRSHTNVFGAFKVLAPGSKWSIIGIMAVLSAGFIIAFYCVVGGWSIEYLVKAICFDFTRHSEIDPSAMFSGFVTSPVKPIIYTCFFLALTGAVIFAGVKKGIEKFTKVMMPLLFIMVIIIAIRSLTLPGSMEGISYLFKPDFSKITSSTVLAAMGQAFFSLSLGCGTILTYASYVDKNENIIACSTYTSLADTIFAIIAGCAIMPAVFAFGISPQEGPGLVFITLPHIFAQLPFGGIIAILFFFTLFLAALTSSISLLEVIVAYMVEEFKMKRSKAVIITFFIFLILGSLCSLSQGVLSDFKIMGRNIFDLFDYLSADYLMTIGGLLIVIFVGWKMGKRSTFEELSNNGTLKIPRWFATFLFFLIKYIAPVTIIIIFISKILE